MKSEANIPGTLNAILTLASIAAGCACLVLASRGPWWQTVVAAVVFSYVNNTTFALLHEAVHGIAHENRRINDAIGRVAAAMFPTSYSLQRIFHLGHHARNRTAFEQFDYIRPGDSRLLKYAQWYAILTGIYWMFVPLGAVAYFVWPGLFRRIVHADEEVAAQTGAASLFAGVDKAPRTAIRLEVLFAAAVHIALVLILGVTARGWFCCYAAFALNWSALQYADHAFSPLDVRDGAWDLRVNPLTRILFLNYHHHRAHHRNPQVPWIHLGAYVDRGRERPSFLRMYVRMWRGPRPIEESRSLEASATSNGTDFVAEGSGVRHLAPEP